MSGTTTRPRLWLHIGSPKTGTTYLQSFFSANRSRLLEQGTLYPLAGRENVAHHRLAWSVSPSSPLGSAEQLYTALMQEVEAQSPRQTLVSSEVFFLDADLKRLASALEGFDVHVLVYLRRQDVWLKAMVAQAIKEDHYRLRSLSGAADMPKISRHLDYAAALGNWSRTFGHDRISVRSYESESRDGRLLSGFLSLLNVAVDDGWPRPNDPGAQNISLHDDELELVRLSNAIETEKRGRDRWLYQMQRIASRRNKPGSQYAFAGPVRADVDLAAHLEGNKRIADHYCGGEPLFEPLDESAPSEQADSGVLDLEGFTEICALMSVETAALSKALSHRLGVARQIGFYGAGLLQDMHRAAQVVMFGGGASGSQARALASCLSAVIAAGSGGVSLVTGSPDSPLAAIASGMGVGLCRSGEALATTFTDAAARGMAVLAVEGDVFLTPDVQQIADVAGERPALLQDADHSRLGLWLPARFCDEAAMLLQREADAVPELDKFAEELSAVLNPLPAFEIVDAGMFRIDDIEGTEQTDRRSREDERSDKLRFAKELYLNVIRPSASEMLASQGY